MLETLVTLQDKLIRSSYSLVSLFSNNSVCRTTIGLPFDYSIDLSLPIVVFIILDIMVYVVAFGLMFEYTRSRGSMSEPELASRLRSWGGLCVWIIMLTTLLATFVLFTAVCPQPPGLSFFGGLYTISLTSQAWKIVSMLVWIVWLRFFTRHYTAHLSNIIILSALSLSFGLSMLSINHFILLFLALEGLSLTSYIMTAAGRQFGSVTGAVQYFIYGSLGSMLLLLGLVTLYSSFKVLTISVWSSAIGAGALSLSTSPELLSYTAAASFVLLGMLIKFGAAPLHAWVIEVYANVSYHIMWFFSTFIKTILGITVLRIMSSLPVTGLAEGLGVLSLIVGCFGAIRQSDIKRLFAYGSVMHVGFLLVSSGLAYQVYILAYVLSMIAIGASITSVRLNGQEAIYLSDLAQGLAQSKPSVLTSLIIGLLSVSGVPPLAGFWGKYYVIREAMISSVVDSRWILVLVAIILIVTLAAFVYYFRLALWICLNIPSEPKSHLAGSNEDSALQSFLVLLSGVLVAFTYIVYITQDLWIN